MIMLNAQSNGRLFETEIHSFLNRTKHDVLMNEKQIRQIDNTITAIDHLLIMNDICYCFQDKWLKNTISNSDFNHFIKCVESVSTKINYNKIYAIYLSNNDLSSIANKIFIEENNKYFRGESNIEYIKINSYDKKIVIKKLHEFLHSNGIYVYDNNGDCVML
jgi:hypothetical protein